ncbi:hypothetical protein Sjap_016527 [Stephania japonica]|uniref:Uncharacterized protein n=1 Tax=Stephania japonica TaxID=461633 RepID=A0AAP0NTW3_9MAGN
MSSRGMLPHAKDGGRGDHGNATSPDSSTHNASSPQSCFHRVVQRPSSSHHSSPSPPGQFYPHQTIRPTHFISSPTSNSYPPQHTYTPLPHYHITQSPSGHMLPPQYTTGPLPHTTSPQGYPSPSGPSSHHTTPSPPSHHLHTHSTSPLSCHATSSSHDHVHLPTGPSSSRHFTSLPHDYVRSPPTGPSSSRHFTSSPHDHVSSPPIGPSSSRHASGSPHDHLHPPPTRRRRRDIRRTPEPFIPEELPPENEEIPEWLRLDPTHTLTPNGGPLIRLTFDDYGLLDPSSVASRKATDAMKTGYLKDAWKWDFVPQEQRIVYFRRWKVWFTWDERLSWRVYYAWLRKAAKRYTDNVYKMVHRRHAPAYLTDEVFQNYKKMRESDDFKEKSAKMSANRMTEKGGPGTGISLHNCGSISATEHKRTLTIRLERDPTYPEVFRHLHTITHDGHTFVDQRSERVDANITRRMEELAQTQETPIDENAIYLQVVKPVKGRVYGLGSQGYITLGASSSHGGPTYGPHENETLGRDFERVQEEMQRDITECRQENQELRERYARMEALVFERFGITPSSTEPPPPPPSTDPSSRHLDDLHEDAYVVDTRHLTGDASRKERVFIHHLPIIGTTAEEDIVPIHIYRCFERIGNFWMIMKSS